MVDRLSHSFRTFRHVLQGPHHQLADVMLKDSGTFVPSLETLQRIVNRLRHVVAAAQLNTSCLSPLRKAPMCASSIETEGEGTK